jgi:hypothetical protein
MNRNINTIVVLTSALAVSLAFGSVGKAEPQAQLKPLNLEQIHGEVRAVLLRTGQVISTTNPLEFVVTYVVEVPTNGAFSDLHFSSDKEIALGIRGKPVVFHGSISTISMEFKKLPRQSELTEPKERAGKAMLAQETVFHGLKIDARKIDLRLRFDWRGREMLFDFKDVPLN